MPLTTEQAALQFAEKEIRKFHTSSIKESVGVTVHANRLVVTEVGMMVTTLVSSDIRMQIRRNDFDSGLQDNHDHTGNAPWNIEPEGGSGSAVPSEWNLADPGLSIYRFPNGGLELVYRVGELLNGIPTIQFQIMVTRPANNDVDFIGYYWMKYVILDGLNTT